MSSYHEYNHVPVRMDNDHLTFLIELKYLYYEIKFILF